MGKTDSIIEKNHDLRKRMLSSKWIVEYSSKEDTLYIRDLHDGGEYYMPLGREGFMLRVNDMDKIVGIACEDFSLFVKSHPEFKAVSRFLLAPKRFKIFNSLRKIGYTEKNLIELAENYSAGRLVFN